MTDSIGSRCRVGACESPIAANQRPTRPEQRVPNDSACTPENGNSFRPASASFMRPRTSTSSTPATSTPTEIISGTLTPCHSARCVSA